MDLIDEEEWKEIEDGITSTTSSHHSSNASSPPIAENPAENEDSSMSEADSDESMTDTEDQQRRQTVTHLDVDGRAIIQQLQRLERALIKLLEIGADSIDLLANASSFADDENRFRQVARAYFELLDKIQHGLRSTVHTMTLAGLLRLTATTGSVYSVPRRPDIAQLIQKHESLLPAGGVDELFRTHVNSIGP